MEKIYHETEEKSGNYNTGSPWVSVQLFRPIGLEEDKLPAIIVLEAGKVTSDGMLGYGYQKHVMVDWHHNGAEVIRKAIKAYDRFKRKVYRTAEEGGA